MTGPRNAPSPVPLRAWCRGSVLRHAPHGATAVPPPEPLATSLATRPVPVRSRLARDLALGCAWAAARTVQGLRGLGVLRPNHVSRLVPVIVRMADAADWAQPGRPSGRRDEA
ncbi:hypothetical protein Gdia_1203 [Gluconacetobacter diazotrophicus PA1 5]|uniref:hypothetical protein n=1 Tax=Gluconacetobacter diazotrophicus TaxID=33996 RepID=UPI000173CF1C|nr:hypothetical protein [Gluconacetobacter diazotrophicus]ACI50986.1 hypothetical protein Gdia_1203 [Gluconacetobacter diazotrophicus PA1 5]TWB08559.1 hypothetical protein FBZ86_10656 [Gluconacetobacter diazotrophicus]